MKGYRTGVVKERGEYEIVGGEIQMVFQVWFCFPVAGEGGFRPSRSAYKT